MGTVMKTFEWEDFLGVVGEMIKEGLVGRDTFIGMIVLGQSYTWFVFLAANYPCATHFCFL